MEKYKWITSIEDEDGEPLVIGNEKFYYSAFWTDIHAEKDKQHIQNGNDVRVANYVLNELGIPCIRAFADDTAEDTDSEPIGWKIYWA
jgi:hypothetical protein